MAYSVYRPIVPVRLVGGGKTLVTYAMLDQAATSSAVMPKLVKELGVESRTVEATVTSFGHRTVGEVVMTNLSVEPLDGSCSIPLENVVVCEVQTMKNLIGIQTWKAWII